MWRHESGKPQTNLVACGSGLLEGGAEIAVVSAGRTRNVWALAFEPKLEDPVAKLHQIGFRYPTDSPAPPPLVGLAEPSAPAAGGGGGRPYRRRFGEPVIAAGWAFKDHWRWPVPLMVCIGHWRRRHWMHRSA